MLVGGPSANTRTLTNWEIDDLIEAIDQNVGYWTPSAVSTINGQDVIPFLTQFAAINAPGNVEPHADWNDLMSSAAGDVQGIFSVFEGNTKLYPGENITFNFENGSTTDSLPWLAWYSNIIVDNPPSLSTGQDLYSYFVLGVAPASNSTAITSTSTPLATSTSFAAASATVANAVPTNPGSAEATPSSWAYSPFYPDNPVVSQPNLGLLNGGVVTGYFLNDGVTAVLSIPSFDVTAEAVASFSSTIGLFLQKSKAAGLTRFIVDLQRNDGGSDLLATDAFKQVIMHAKKSMRRKILTGISSSQLSNHSTEIASAPTHLLTHLATRSPLTTLPKI